MRTGTVTNDSDRRGIGPPIQRNGPENASCGKAGSVTYTCTRCGDHYDEELPAPEHDYRKTETAPDGTVTFTCSLCGDTYTEAGGSDGEQTAFVASGEASDARGNEITVTDQGEVTVSYIKRSWNGRRVVETLVTDTAVPVPSDPTKMTEGRYYVNRNIDLSDKTAYIFLRGDTELILGSGYTMSVSGLFIPEGHTLTIYKTHH